MIDCFGIHFTNIIFNLIGKEIESLKYMSFVHVRLTKPSIFRKNNSNIIVPLLYLTILCKYHTNIQYQVAINLTRKKDVFFRSKIAQNHIVMMLLLIES